jgi:glycine dehydrogenase subunit 1
VEGAAAVIIGWPNFLGVVEPLPEAAALAKKAGALTIAVTAEAVALGLLEAPGALGADVAVGTLQSFGNPVGFGGPAPGFFAIREQYLRQMPGRVCGATLDKHGRRGFVLTLSTREQHIRREKATSNICSNQALCALRALIHLSLLGPEGLARTATLGMERAHQAAERLCALPGVSRLGDGPFGNEFAVRLPISAYEAIDKLTARGFVPGFPLGRYYAGLENCLLVACTEKHSASDVGILAEHLAEITGGAQ